MQQPSNMFSAHQLHNQRVISNLTSNSAVITERLVNGLQCTNGSLQFINETDSIIAAGYDGPLRVYNIGPSASNKRPASAACLSDDCSSDSDINMTSSSLQHAANDGPRPGKKTKGRVKIRMEFIENKLRRYTTFSKRKTGIMKKAYELSTLTGTQVMLLVASETGHVYTFATRKLQPMITSESGKALIQTCLNSPDTTTTTTTSPQGVTRTNTAHNSDNNDNSLHNGQTHNESSQSNALQSHFVSAVNASEHTPVTVKVQITPPPNHAVTSQQLADTVKRKMSHDVTYCDSHVQDLSVTSRPSAPVIVHKPMTSSLLAAHRQLNSKNTNVAVVGPCLSSPSRSAAAATTTTTATTTSQQQQQLATQLTSTLQLPSFYKIPGTNQLISLNPALNIGNRGTVIYQTSRGLIVGTSLLEHSIQTTAASATTTQLTQCSSTTSNTLKISPFMKCDVTTPVITNSNNQGSSIN